MTPDYDLSKVSSRPWKLDGRRDVWNLDGLDGEPQYLFAMPCKSIKDCENCDANAAHIVHCVNAHDSLRDTIRGLCDALEAACTHIYDLQGDCPASSEVECWAGCRGDNCESELDTQAQGVDCWKRFFLDNAARKPEGE